MQLSTAMITQQLYCIDLLLTSNLSPLEQLGHEPVPQPVEPLSNDPNVPGFHLNFSSWH